ncbi:MAG: hypothetical protein ACJAXQ_001789 [Parvibaculaceae bacterium]|jgi:hypothetical protein|nr:PilZ domain-containing protein [Parvibaculaceae bacterium]
MQDWPPIERRECPRIDTFIEGRIVFASTDTDCIIHEMSASGAVVEVLPLPDLGDEIALDAPGIGFSRGEVVGHFTDGVRIKLHTSAHTKNRIATRLSDPAKRFYPPEK